MLDDHSRRWQRQISRHVPHKLVTTSDMGGASLSARAAATCRRRGRLSSDSQSDRLIRQTGRSRNTRANSLKLHRKGRPQTFKLKSKLATAERQRATATECDINKARETTTTFLQQQRPSDSNGFLGAYFQVSEAPSLSSALRKESELCPSVCLSGAVGLFDSSIPRAS